jgi:hypothetical protein
MTESGRTSSPEHQSSPEPAAGTDPATARVAKLNAANMARSMLPLVVICLLLVGWVALRQPSEDLVREIDPTSSVRTSAERAGYALLVPAGLGEDYRPTSARTTAGRVQEGDPVTLEIGYVTPQEEYAGFVISDDDAAEPLRRVLDGAQEQGTVRIDGQVWTRATTERGETALSRETGDATVLVFGSAGEEELTEVAAAVQPYRD